MSSLSSVPEIAIEPPVILHFMSVHLFGTTNLRLSLALNHRPHKPHRMGHMVRAF